MAAGRKANLLPVQSIQPENRGTHILTLTCGSWEPNANGGGIPMYTTARKHNFISPSVDSKEKML